MSGKPRVYTLCNARYAKCNMPKRIRSWYHLMRGHAGEYAVRSDQFRSSVLIDGVTKAVLAIHPNIASILFVRECTIDTLYIRSVSAPKGYPPIFLKTLPPSEYPLWKWDSAAQTLTPSLKDTLTDEIRCKSRLAIGKAQTIGRIIASINIARSALDTGLLLQQSIYLTKKIQAHEFRKGGYDESTILTYPFVLQYADFYGISSQQAADDIIFKAKLADDALAKTELLRLKYFNRVRIEKSSDALSSIYDEFERDLFRNAKI